MKRNSFQAGDLVQHLNGDEVFAVVGTYYDEDLRPHLFVSDMNGKIFGVAPDFYKPCSDSEKIHNASY